MKKTKHFKRIMALMLVVVMAVAMNLTSFAAGSSDTVSVQFWISTEFYDFEGELITDMPQVSSEDYTLDLGNNMYRSELYQIPTDGYSSCPVTKPSGFAGLFDTAEQYVPTVFDAIYYAAVVRMGQSVQEYGSASITPNTEFIYGFDTYSVPNGIYINRLSKYYTRDIYTNYSAVPGESMWAGYSWSLYVVPAGVSFDPSNPDAAYKTAYYANNIDLQDGQQIYMVYEYNQEIW